MAHNIAFLSRVRLLSSPLVRRTRLLFVSMQPPALSTTSATQTHSISNPISTPVLAPVSAPSLLGRADPRTLWQAFVCWLDALPAFWLAFASTVVGTLGAGVLALPIAVARLGPLPGVVLLLFLGLMNVITIAYMAEVAGRNEDLRTGRAFIGRVVHDYLGGFPALVFTVATSVYCFVLLLSYYIGFSAALSAATPIPAPMWTLVIFAIGLYYLRSGSFSSTVASTMIIGVVNLALLLGISLVALPHVQWDNLMAMNLPFVGGHGFDPKLLELAFGVILYIFASHITVGNSARIVLPRDPSGRALIWGAIAGLSAVIIVYCVWVLAVGGVMDAEALAAETGTALAPLANVVGRSIHVMGFGYVILTLGLGSVYYTLGMVHLVRDQLGTRLSEQTRMNLALIPLLAVFVMAEQAAFTGRGSFVWLISIGGALTAPLFAGIFPILLLRVSRRSSHAPTGFFLRLCGHPLMILLSYLIFVSSLFLHAFLIWQSMIPKTAALLTGLVAVGMTLVLLIDVRRLTVGRLEPG